MLNCYRLIFIFICFSAGPLFASHIIGGSLGYEYMGLQANGKYRYKVLLTTYIDCSPTSEIPFAEDPLKVGVFANDINNPNADKVRIDSVTVTLVNSVTYLPTLPPDCPLAQSSCILEARYEGYVDLNASASGYYLFYERCCRNIGILNLQPEESAAYISYIPPTNVINSSPVFIDPPIPFICANDPTIMLNTATDNDGDSLVYQFSTAFNGYGDEFNTTPPLPQPFLLWPVPTVIFAPGYNVNQPFGAIGTATLNTNNGIAEYTVPIIGPYVVTIDVFEYRNGILIGSIRRDLQIIVIPCPNNYAPQLVDNLQRNYTVMQGDTLCFPISFEDPENDSVFIEAHGDIFDALVIDTPATFFITDIDSNRATGNFCWTIPCTLDTGTYEFFMKSYDNGCPPKDKYEFYTIRITPPIEPILFGADSACKGADSVLYWMVVDNHFTYDWNITNGTILHNYGDSIVISWGSLDSAEVFVDVYTAAGCYISSDSMMVTLIDVPTLFAMPNDTVCRNDTLLLWATGSVNYYWYPETELVIPVEGDADAIIQQSGWFYVAGLPGELCPPSDSVYILAWELPQLNAATNDTSLCEGDTIHLFSSGAEVYYWTPDILVFEPDSANTDALPIQSSSFIVMGIDSNQCRSFDTVYVEVGQQPLIGLAAISQLCDGDTATLTASGGMYYNWTPNSFLLPDTGATIFAFPNMDITYYLEVIDSNGCKSDTSFSISVEPSPTASFSFDTVKVDCSGAWIQFNNTSTGAVDYHWSLGNGNTTTNLDPQTLFPFGNTYIVQLITTNAAQCTATYTDTISTDSLENLAIINPVNVFTPNDDGINDVLDFNLPDEFLECAQVYVYDRWGLLLFESTTSDVSWNGKVDGKKVTIGVYYWIVELNGLTYKGFGHVFE